MERGEEKHCLLLVAATLQRKAARPFECQLIALSLSLYIYKTHAVSISQESSELLPQNYCSLLFPFPS